MNAAIPLWTVFVILGAVLVLNSAWAWFTDRYEVAGGKHSGFRLWRRWYGLHAQVVLREDEDDTDPDRYTVLAWDDENSDAPWIKVIRLDPEYLTYWDEDAEAFWARVTDFAPYAVRRFRPYVFRFGWLPVPWLTKYVPVRRPAGYVKADA